MRTLIEPPLSEVLTFEIQEKKNDLTQLRPLVCTAYLTGKL